MLTAMLAALLGGIILNVMPCVFPIVSLKALGLMRHDGDTASARTEGIGFLLGTLAAMMVLAGNCWRSAPAAAPSAGAFSCSRRWLSPRWRW